MILISLFFHLIAKCALFVTTINDPQFEKLNFFVFYFICLILRVLPITTIKKNKNKVTVINVCLPVMLHDLKKKIVIEEIVCENCM